MLAVSEQILSVVNKYKEFFSLPKLLRDAADLQQFDKARARIASWRRR
jgi:hypothetical protein